METAQFLGNIGELVGAIGVVVTLVYLAIQVRHSKQSTDANTRALEEARALAISQAYENRTNNLLAYFLDTRDSAFISEFNHRQEDEGQARYRLNMRWWQAYTDNLHYQYSKGYLDEEYVDGTLDGAIRAFAPRWRAAGVTEARQGFREVVDRILAESEHPASTD
jgi:hypothetical protein